MPCLETPLQQIVDQHRRIVKPYSTERANSVVLPWAESATLRPNLAAWGGPDPAGSGQLRTSIFGPRRQIAPVWSKCEPFGATFGHTSGEPPPEFWALASDPTSGSFASLRCEGLPVGRWPAMTARRPDHTASAMQIDTELRTGWGQTEHVRRSWRSRSGDPLSRPF